MIRPVDDEYEQGSSPARRDPTAESDHRSVSHLDTVDELAAAMAVRSRKDALIYLNDWLERRDGFADDLATDDLVTALKLLAAELRWEAAKPPNQHTPGLTVAASVLTDAARDVRAGDPLGRDGKEMPA